MDRKCSFILFTLLFFLNTFGAKAPRKLRGLTAIAISCTEVQLSWKASRKATGYEVCSINGKLIISVSTNSCTIAGLKPLGNYIFRVRAINADESSDFAVSNVVTTQMCDTAFHWGKNTYPWKLTLDECPKRLPDPYYFDMFSCASYVAWKINNLLGDTSTAFKGCANFPFNDFMNGGTKAPSPENSNSADPIYCIGDAGHWATALKELGYVVDNTPAVGAIAQWKAYENGVDGHGHVAFVDSVSGNDVFLSNYNGISITRRKVSCSYGYFHINMAKPNNMRTNWLPGRFIHIDRVRKIGQ